MTLLGTGLFLAGSRHPVGPGPNAAPSIDAVTLHFDIAAQSAPTGQNLALAYLVPPPGNAVPALQDVTLHFDIAANTPPQGSDRAVGFLVPAA